MHVFMYNNAIIQLFNDTRAGSDTCCAGFKYLCCLFVACRLIVGLCVGVPAIVLIIVGVVVVYCACAHYQSRKMQRLALSHRRHSRRRGRRDQQDDTTYLAPPPYTSSSTADPNTSRDSELPGYSTTDPYANITSNLPAEPATAAPDVDDQRGGAEGNTSSGQEGREMTEMENLPLLSEDEAQS